VNPVKSGSNFVWWYKEAALTNYWNFDSDTVTADTMLYARWVAADTINLAAQFPPYAITGSMLDYTSGTVDGLYTVRDSAVVSVINATTSE